MIKLRAFCLRSLAGLTFLALAPWNAGAASRRKITPLTSLSFEKLAGELGSMFHVQTGEGRVLALRLIRAEWKSPSPRSAPNAPDAAFEKFSLVFAGSRAHQLPQETYPFEHRRLGRFGMFIVPVGTLDPAVHHYEAVFNRPVVA